MLSPLSLSCLLLHFFVVFATEFTFELPDNDKLCFYEELEKDVKFDIDYQVISGGNYDVDCFVTDPLDNILYNENKKQYDSFSHTTAMRGTYRVCFSNEFSTFSHKSIYLDFRHGDEDPLLPGMTRATALTHPLSHRSQPEKKTAFIRFGFVHRTQHSLSSGSDTTSKEGN
ncbi:transmembrane emp24 domain-containing protein 3 isoform X2 [Phyllopteryx taeniolatus]|uniref:transmembrane emp24 domain-containing protein 3 isoform X2 n=1 Tax=Phyllopteryx taeniolatus TaxID=161469 RepID=UPI002AD4168B|nr:transmembrane emp24 domain-containing protein 3 isoform X2 [Phyllopteryx taeniolatus]